MNIAHSQMRHFNLQELAEAVKNLPDNAKIRGSNDDSFTLYSSEKKKGSETVTTKKGFFANIVKSFQEKSIQKREKKQEVASNILRQVFQNAMDQVENDPSKTKALEHILNKAPKDLTARHLKSMVSDALDVVEPGRVMKQQLENLHNKADELTKLGNGATTIQWTGLIKQLARLSKQPGMADVEIKVSTPLKNAIFLKAFDGLVKTSANEGHQGGGLLPSARKVVLKLMEQYTTAEVNSSSSPGTLFRGSDVLTPSLMKYEAAFVFNENTKQFLKNMVQNESMKVTHDLVKEEDRGGSLNFFTGQFNDLCDHLGISDDPNVRQTGVQRMPQEICDQMRLIYDKVSQKYGHDEGVKAVGGALLLRLINPALTSPHTDEDVQPLKLAQVRPRPDPTVEPPLEERAFASNMREITSMLQTLANNTALQGNREALNPSIQGRQQGWSQFVAAIVNRGLPSTSY